MPPNAYLVSAIVSTYQSERFFRGCLEDLVAQTLYQQGRLQIIIIDSNSPQNEQAIAREFQTRYPHLVFQRTGQRESIYAAWNRAIGLAEGRYVTNANTDDRHRPDALEKLAAVLEAESAGLVYADSLVTSHPNETFPNNHAGRILRWPPFSVRQLLVCSIFGPQPMWRRAAHERAGWFDPNYVVAGDYEFFIRLAAQFGAAHLPETLGLYYDGGLENQNRERCRDESARVLHVHRRKTPLETIYPLLASLPKNDEPLARAAALVDFGNIAMARSGRDLALACQCFEQAAALAPHHPAPINNRAVLLCWEEKRSEAEALLKRIKAPPLAQRNLRKIRKKAAAAKLELDAIAHPVWRSLPPLESPGSAMQSLNQSGGLRSRCARAIARLFQRARKSSA